MRSSPSRRMVHVVGVAPFVGVVDCDKLLTRAATVEVEWHSSAAADVDNDVVVVGDAAAVDGSFETAVAVANDVVAVAFLIVADVDRVSGQ